MRLQRRRRRFIRSGLIGGWTPAALFADGQNGLWLEASPTYKGDQVLWQQSDGTVIVDAHGDPVGRGDDLSGNANHLTQATSADRPTYNTDGTLHWLTGDGVSDSLFAPWFQQAVQDQLLVFSFEQVSAGGFRYLFGAASDRGVGLIVDNGALRPYVRTTAGVSAFNGSTISNGSRVVVSVEWDRAAGGLRLYLNGVLDGQLAVGANDLVTDVEHELMDRPGTAGNYNVKIYGAIGISGDLSGRSQAGEYLAEIAGITI